MQPAPVTPPFEPPPLSASVAESNRRILWIVALYRAVCGAVLLGIALLADLQSLQVAAPQAFVTASGLYFLFALGAFWWLQQQQRLPVALPILSLTLLSADILMLAMIVVAGGTSVAPLPILLFPQLAASGWLLRTQTAFFHAALATLVLLGLDLARAFEGRIAYTQLLQTAMVCLGYFAMVGVAVALGRYTKASEDLAAQRGIDVANLEQVNRLIIQDMQDGVLVVDLNGVVRGHNAQVTRLLGGFGRMRGGMRLSEFSSVLHDYWRRWQEDITETLPPFKVDATQRLLRVRLVRIGSGLNGGTLIYLEDLGRAQSEAQQMKLAAMGRLTASIAHEVRNPLSAINQAAQLLEEDGAVAPEGMRLLTMIRNNARRIDRIVGEVLQLNRRDRQQPDIVALGEFVHGLVEEIVQAENMPAGAVMQAIPPDLVALFDRGHLEPDPVEPGAQRLAALPEEGGQRAHRRPRGLHGRRGHRGARRRRPRHPGRAAQPDLRAVLHHAPGRHRARALHRPRARRRQRRHARAHPALAGRTLPHDAQARAGHPARPAPT